MKNFAFILLMFVLTVPSYSQIVDGQFSTNISGSNYQVTVAANMQSGAGSAGVVAIWFTFNASGLSLPGALVAGVDYVVQGNFTTYNTQNITRFGPNEVRINLVTSGTPAPLSTTPTPIVVLNFTIINAAQLSMLTWTKTEIAPAFLQLNYTIGNWPGYSAPLPVELSSFAAKMYDQDKVKLNWKTQTEVNNYGFDVERQANNGQWEKVGFVNGNGNSNSPKEYSYIDKSLIGGSKFLYRLKQVDNDGQFEYSDIVEVEVIPNKFELSQNYPNPFNPSTSIRFSLPKQAQLKISLYNTIGEIIETIAEGIYEAGFYKVTFNASNLPSGMYIYRIESSDFVQTKKMMLLK